MKNADSIIEKIKKEQIKPTPKWVFLLRNSLVWSLFILSVLIGIVATSVLIYAFEGVYEELLEHAGHSRLEMVLLLFPIFWLITLIGFIIFAVVLGKRTKTGYRYPIFYYVIASILFSVMGGYIVYKNGGAEKIEHIFSEKLKIVKSTEEKRMSIWSMPEDGFLSGIVISFDNDEIQLMDFREKQWSIDKKEAFIRPSVHIAKGAKIKLLGEINSPDEFIAEEIRPWKGKGKRLGKGRSEKRQNQE